MNTVLSTLLVVFEHFARQPALVLLLVFVLALLCGFGRSFGLPGLIYHPRRRTRIVNGLALGALIGWVAFVAHLNQWQDWAGETGFDMEAWGERFSPIPAHVGYLVLYTAGAVALALVFALPLALMGRSAANPRSSVGWGGRAAFVGVLVLGWFTFLIPVGAAAHWLPNQKGTGSLYWVEEFDAGAIGFETSSGEGLVVREYHASAWPSYARKRVAQVLVLALVAISLLAAIPGVRRRAPRVSPIVVFALAAVAVTGVIDGLALLLNDTVSAGLTKLGLESEQGARDAWLRNTVGLANLLVLVLVIVLTSVAGLRKYRTRLPNVPGTDGWGGQYRHSGRVRVDTPPATTPAAPSEGTRAKDREPVVVVAVSGGGITAAVWAFTVLTELDRRTRTGEGRRPFPKAAKVITGASGGMLGAAYYAALVADLPEGEPPNWEQERRNVAEDCLSPVLRAQVFHDLIWSLLPLVSRYDRGQALEGAWAENLGDTLSRPVSKLADAERNGTIPSLVFSPMLVEDGRRLLVSNSDFGWLHDYQPRSFVEFSKLFPDALGRLSVATAVRMSATFPLVSPAIVLPTEPRRRVVDAGYFDNYGVHLGAAWIRHLRHIGGEEAPPVALVEVRAFERLEPAESSRIERGWEDVLTPVQGLGTARKAVTAFRNDELLELLSQEMGTKLTRFVFQGPPGLPLSWFLTPDERDQIISGLCSDESRAALAKFDEWWVNVGNAAGTPAKSSGQT